MKKIIIKTFILIAIFQDISTLQTQDYQQPKEQYSPKDIQEQQLQEIIHEQAEWLQEQQKTNWLRQQQEARLPNIKQQSSKKSYDTQYHDALRRDYQQTLHQFNQQQSYYMIRSDGQDILNEINTQTINAFEKIHNTLLQTLTPKQTQMFLTIQQSAFQQVIQLSEEAKQQLQQSLQEKSELLENLSRTLRQQQERMQLALTPQAKQQEYLLLQKLNREVEYKREQVEKKQKTGTSRIVRRLSRSLKKLIFFLLNLKIPSSKNTETTSSFVDPSQEGIILRNQPTPTTPKKRTNIYFGDKTSSITSGISLDKPQEPYNNFISNKY